MSSVFSRCRQTIAPTACSSPRQYHRQHVLSSPRRLGHLASEHRLHYSVRSRALSSGSSHFHTSASESRVLSFVRRVSDLVLSQLQDMVKLRDQNLALGTLHVFHKSSHQLTTFHRIKVHFKDSKGNLLKTVEANEGDDLLSIAHEYDIDLEGMSRYLPDLSCLLPGANRTTGICCASVRHSPPDLPHRRVRRFSSMLNMPRYPDPRAL